MWSPSVWYVRPIHRRSAAAVVAFRLDPSPCRASSNILRASSRRPSRSASLPRSISSCTCLIMLTSTGLQYDDWPDTPVSGRAHGPAMHEEPPFNGRADAPTESMHPRALVWHTRLDGAWTVISLYCLPFVRRTPRDAPPFFSRPEASM